MAYLTDEDFENIPEDDHEAFVSLAGISYERLQSTERDNHDNLSWEAVMDYMNEVTALADQLGIEGIHYDPDYDQYHAEYARFTRSVEYRLAQIRVQRARRNRRSSISISGPGRERIHHYLERLKDEIRGAGIPEKRKRTLLDCIADFETELAKKRFNLATAMAVAALVAAAAADFSGLLKDAPSLMDAISAVLGHEKQKDDAAQERLRLEHEPLKAIPDMRPKAEPAPAPARVPALSSEEGSLTIWTMMFPSDDKRTLQLPPGDLPQGQLARLVRSEPIDPARHGLKCRIP